jgi:hypothetical protein
MDAHVVVVVAVVDFFGMGVLVVAAATQLCRYDRRCFGVVVFVIIIILLYSSSKNTKQRVLDCSEHSTTTTSCCGDAKTGTTSSRSI